MPQRVTGARTAGIVCVTFHLVVVAMLLSPGIRSASGPVWPLEAADGDRLELPRTVVLQMPTVGGGGGVVAASVNQHGRRAQESKGAIL
jgi:hypothetical protein